MQCVDRGLIGLDDDVTQVTPELKDIKLLTGFDEDDKPLLHNLQHKLTPEKSALPQLGLLLRPAVRALDQVASPQRRTAPA